MKLASTRGGSRMASKNSRRRQSGLIIIYLMLRIIEEVIFKSCPTPLGKKQRAAPTDMKVNDRVEKIINDLFEFGVSIEVLFDVDDLVKAKNIPKVSFCFN